MGRGKLSAKVRIEVNGEVIPYLTIDKDGNITWLVSDEQQKEYEQAMLTNMGASMSGYYTAHPEQI